MKLYYIKLTINSKPLYKIGYTAKTLKQRFCKWNRYDVELLFVFETNRAKTLEQTLIKLNHHLLIANPISFREVFSEDIFKVRLDTITLQYLIQLENDFFISQAN